MPTEANEVYECDICGAVVEVKEGGAGTLECCGQPMTLQEQYKATKPPSLNDVGQALGMTSC